MNEPRIITLPKIFDPRGNLSFIQNGDGRLPFDISRCYWIYDVPSGLERHGHAFRRQQELIVALAGSFDVVLDDGSGPRHYRLSQPDKGICVPPMTWRRIDNFATCSVAMVLSSHLYDPADYIEDYDQYLELAKAAKIANIAKIATVAPLAADSHARSSLDRCGIVELPRHRHPNGSLTVVENDGRSPFDIRRVFYLYDVPGDSERGGHSHYRAQELIVAAGGSFDVTLDDGRRSLTFTLNRPYQALYVEAGIWRSLNNFSSGSVSLVLTSEEFDEADYVRDYDTFLQLTSTKIQ